MTHYQPTPSKRTRPLVQLLIVTMIAATIVAIIACSGEQPQPTPTPQATDESPMHTIDAMAQEIADLQDKAAEPSNEDHSPIQTIEAMASQIATLQTKATATPQTTDKKPMQTIDAMAQEIKALQTKAAVPTETAEPDETEHSAQLEPNEAPATLQPTPPPATEVIIPTRSGPGICNRSPAIQEAILLTLKATSCRTVTEAELYRIQCFRNIRHECENPHLRWGKAEPRPGDFAGLVNLRYLETLTTSPIRPNTFAGSSITNLKLTALSIDKGAFQGAQIESLELHTEGIPSRGTLPASLKHLQITTTAPLEPMTGNEFEDLINLEWLTIHIRRAEGREEFQKLHKGEDADSIEITFTLPAQMTHKNTKLRGIQIAAVNHGDSSRAAHITVDDSLFAHLTELEYLAIGNLKTANHLSGNPPLSLNTRSPLHQYLNDPSIGKKDYSNADTHQEYVTRDWIEWEYGESIYAKTQDSEPPW